MLTVSLDVIICISETHLVRPSEHNLFAFVREREAAGGDREFLLHGIKAGVLENRNIGAGEALFIRAEQLMRLADRFHIVDACLHEGARFFQHRELDVGKDARNAGCEFRGGAGGF